MAALPSSTALLEGGATGGGTGMGAGAGAPAPPSLVLRLANPQQDTLLRLRVARDKAPTPAAESGAHVGGDDTTASIAVSGDDGAASATAARGVVTVQPGGWKEGDLLRLEGKEDEVLRQPGERHRLPAGALARMGGGSGGGGSSDGDGDVAAAAGGGGGSAAGTGPTPFLVHQEGDVAWVRVPLDRDSVDRVAAAAGAISASARASLVVDVRFSLVMAEGEEGVGGEAAGGSGEDVSMPISVRFPLSKCPV